MNQIAETILMHYGMPRRSGRYPWGSGENPYQHSGDFLARVEALQKMGVKEADIAEEFHTSSTNLRTYIRIAKHERRQLLRDQAKSLSEDGKTPTEIARIMGFPNESSVRNLLRDDINERKNVGQQTADVLREMINSGKMLDVGDGANLQLGVSTTALQEAITILEGEGYSLHKMEVPQTTNKGQRTTNLVLTKGDVEDKQVWNNMDKVEGLVEYTSDDGGQTFRKFKYPESIDSSRIAVNYADTGTGKSKDGLMELRRGVEDLDLGDAAYAQVRILVDGTHYLKGMAMYGSDDEFPPGVDIIFNTSKNSDLPLKGDKSNTSVLKPIEKDDPDNPFGAQLSARGQSEYVGKDGKLHLSAINKVKEESDWDEMSKSLSSQFLSKQPLDLIKRQLNLTYAEAEDEFSEIMSLENPTLKKKMLLDYADKCDGAAQHLKAAALPRQTCQVILPIPELKENEVFAPNYNNGEQLALVRYPHGGQFEIPILTVNNKNKEGRDRLGMNVKDAIGVNPKAAERLSGADFDGDFVIAIPTGSNGVTIKNKPVLKGLENFEPKEVYREVPGMKVLQKGSATQREMGIISNLITDMTLHGASEDELARAVRHSMVIIDAAKHKLNYKQSEKDNKIDELKKLYQVPYNESYDENGNKIEGKGGASTLFSRRKQSVYVPERKGGARIDPETGEVSYRNSGRKYYDKNGNLVDATIKVSRISQTPDLNALSSGTPQETAYADYGNKMKALANRCRKEAVNTPGLKYNSEAAKEYASEVASLNQKVKTALLNAPVERAANRIANVSYRDKVRGITDAKARKEYLKKTKYRQMELNQARAQVGKKTREATEIKITDREWAAIQKGAISNTMLTKILRYANQDELRERAMPRTTTTVPVAKQARIKAMEASGYTNADIARAVGLSPSTVAKYTGHKQTGGN